MSSKLQINFFYILLILVSVLTFFIFLPYFQALFLAVVAAVVAYPLYGRILRSCRGVKSLASIISLIVVFFLVVIPLAIIVILLTKELIGVYDYFVNGGGGLAIFDYIGQVQQFLAKLVPENFVPQPTINDVQNYLNSTYGWAGSHITSIFSNVVSFLTNTVIFVLGLFFFLRDGHKFKELLIKASPLKDGHDERLLHMMALSIRSVVKGSLLVALIQGILISFGFFIFGVQSPILWGVVTVIASLLPGVGAFLIILPASIYLFVVTGWGQGLGLLLWGIVVITITDNFLRPYLLERGIRIHPFLILLSVFGGFVLFGTLGFLIGPIILSLLFALIEIHPEVTALRKQV